MNWRDTVQQVIDKLTGMAGYRRPLEEAERKDAESARSLQRFESEVDRIQAAADRIQAVGRLWE